MKQTMRLETPLSGATTAQSLNAFGQSQDQDDQEDDSKSAARVVSPTGIVRPRRKCSDQQQNQDDQQECTHGRKLSVPEAVRQYILRSPRRPLLQRKLLQERARFLSFVGKSRVRPPDASGKFFAHQLWRTQSWSGRNGAMKERGRSSMFSLRTRTLSCAVRVETTPAIPSFIAGRNTSCI